MHYIHYNIQNTFYPNNFSVTLLIPCKCIKCLIFFIELNVIKMTIYVRYILILKYYYSTCSYNSINVLSNVYCIINEIIHRFFKHIIGNKVLEY